MLENTLGFLSDDYYSFEFTRGTERPAEQLSLSTPKGEEERDEAEKFSYDDEVVRIESQMNQMAAFPANETRRGGTVSREPKSAKRSRDRVRKAIKRAIKNINQHSIPLAKHLDEELDRGRLARYRQTGIIWEL